MSALRRNQCPDWPGITVRIGQEYALAVENAADILTQIENQQFSNILYLPPNKEKNEYLAYFDDLSTIEKDELNALKEEIILNRIGSLDCFGYYLFIFKLSYHFCRLPEETER